MVFCCSICQERIEANQSDEDLRTSAIRCGHVFHHICIKNWWLSRFRDPPTTRAELLSQQIGCPICRRHYNPAVFQLSLITRAETETEAEEDSSEVILMKQNIEAVQLESDNLQNELAAKDKELSEVLKMVEAEKIMFASLTKELDAAKFANSQNVSSVKTKALSTGTWNSQFVPMTAGRKRTLKTVATVNTPNCVTRSKRRLEM